MELKVFKNNQFGEVRVIEKDSQAWFCLVDVCRTLEISNVSQLKTRLKKDGIISNEVIDSLGRTQQANFINESNLYKTIFQSRKDSAEQFTEWVTSEVLPSIRKNGGYIANQENLTPEQVVANALVVAQRIIDDKAKKIETMKPKAEFFDAVANSKTAVSLGDVAKVLGIKGLGRNKLFELLRNKKILMKDNIPYQKYVDAGYFRVIEQKYTQDDEVKVNFKTLVFQKGINYIRKLVS